MSVVSMFVHRDADDLQSLRYAAELAKRLDRPLEGVCALPDATLTSAYFGSEFVMGVGVIPVQAISDAKSDLIESTKAAFEAAAQEAGVAPDRTVFRKAVGLVEQIAMDAAVLADTIIFPRNAAKGGASLAQALEAVLMSSRLPLVVAAAEKIGAGPAIIAWDGSEQAARAIMLHAPLIQAAKSVVIAQGEQGLDKRPGGNAHETDRLLAWLSDRGVAAEVKALEGPPGKALLAMARDLDAEMIVCGAYGHSRAGEMLFGGVTRTLLHAENAPALALAH